MLQLSPDANVIVYFEGMIKSMSPVLQVIILEDVKNLLEGKRGEYLERSKELRDHFLEICEDLGVHLSFPLSGNR